MFLKKFLLSLLFVFLFEELVFASSVRSNHSYKNMGFTQSPIVTIGGYSDFKAVYSQQESIFGDKYLPDAKKITPEAGTPNKNNDDIDFNNQTNVSVRVDAINDLGVKYGGVIELEGIFNDPSKSSILSMRKSYIYMESVFGKFEFGNNYGVAQKMKLGAETIARAAGGINGDYLNYINFPMIAHPDYYDKSFVGSNTGIGGDSEYLNKIGNYLKVKLPRFIVVPQHPMSHGGFGIGYDNYIFNCDADGDGKITTTVEKECYNERKQMSVRETLKEFDTATKFSYYTPVILGFQVGASYTPKATNVGAFSDRNAETQESISKIMEFGVTYTNTFGNVGLALSYTIQKGDSNYFIRNGSGILEKRREDLSSTEMGINLTYFGLTLAGSMGNWGDSLNDVKNLNNIYSYPYDETLPVVPSTAAAITTKKFGDSKYYTVGLAYEFGAYNFSATYLGSSFQDNDYTAISLGVDYKLGKGIMPYFEYTMYEFKSAQPNVAIDISDTYSDVIKDNKGGVFLLGVLLNF